MDHAQPCGQTLCISKKSTHALTGQAGDGEACPWEITKDNKIESTDRQIDTLVYELYRLSPEEIRIVEGN